MVEFHTEGLYPSQAGHLGVQSFIRHLISHVETQVPQIQTYSPNIIAVRIDKFTLTSLSLYARVENLNSGMKQLYEKIRNEHIIGIALYHDSLRGSIFFKNPFVSADSNMTNEEMTKLGFHPPTIKDFLW